MQQYFNYKIFHFNHEFNLSVIKVNDFNPFVYVVQKETWVNTL